MGWFVLPHLVGLSVDLLACAREKADEKARRIALLRHQVRLLQRWSPRPPHLARREKLTLAALTARLVRLTHRPPTRLAQSLLLVRPETVPKWHRALVRRKWMYRRRLASGRPPGSPAIVALPPRPATENPRRGDGRLQGEARKLGHALGRSTIRDVLKRRRVPPAPRRRSHATSRRQFLAQHRDAALACDFLTVGPVFLETITVSFCPESGTRRVHPAGGTARPTAARVAQQVRNRCWTVQEQGRPFRLPIPDRDATSPPAFDTVFATEGVAIVRTPYRAPNADAYAERWIRSARAGCLDHLLIANAGYLRRVLTGDVACYNRARPRRGLEQRRPVALHAPARDGPVRRRDTLGGLLHDHDREVA